MRKNDTRLFSLGDVGLAMVLLTRLPMPTLPARAFSRQAKAVWAFPVPGIAVAGCAIAVGWLSMRAGLPPTVVAGLVLCFQILLTGAMHEDGLADTADGFWGGYTRERRLEIMKDSHIGTYGVLALALSVGLRWATLAALIPLAGLIPILAVAVLSRAAMPILMIALPNARGGGLSNSVGKPPIDSALAGGGLALAMSAFLIGIAPTLILVIVGTATLVAIAILAQIKIKGQTGDVLGATQQVLENILLIGCLSMAPVG